MKHSSSRKNVTCRQRQRRRIPTITTTLVMRAVISSWRASDPKCPGSIRGAQPDVLFLRSPRFSLDHFVTIPEFYCQSTTTARECVCETGASVFLHVRAVQRRVVPVVVPDVFSWRRVSTGHILPCWIPVSLPNAVSVLLLQGRPEFAEMTLFSNTLSVWIGTSSRQVRLRVRCRSPEPAPLEEARHLHLGLRAGRQHRCFLPRCVDSPTVSFSSHARFHETHGFLQSSLLFKLQQMSCGASFHSALRLLEPVGPLTDRSI